MYYRQAVCGDVQSPADMHRYINDRPQFTRFLDITQWLFCSFKDDQRFGSNCESIDILKFRPLVSFSTNSSRSMIDLTVRIQRPGSVRVIKTSNGLDHNCGQRAPPTFH